MVANTDHAIVADVPAVASPITPERADVAALRPIGLGLRIQVELRRLVDTRSSQRILAAVAVLSIAFVFAFSSSLRQSDAGIYDYMLTGGQFFAFALPVIAVLTMAAEWRWRTALVTYTLDTRRTAVFVAKVIAVWLLSLVFTLVAAGVGAGVGVAMGVPMTGVTDILAGIGWLTGFLTVYMLVGAAIGAALLNIPGAILLVILGPQMIPSILSGMPATASLAPWVDWLTPLTASVAERTMVPDAAQFAVALIIWIVIPLAFGMWRNARRDAN